MAITATDIGIIAGAGAAILGATAPMIKLFLDFRKSQRDENRAIKDQIGGIDKKIDLNSRDIQRVTLFNEQLPLEERLDAGERYMKTGGNGAGRVYYETLKRKYEGKLQSDGLV